jgi:hypothetical protein
MSVSPAQKPRAHLISCPSPLACALVLTQNCRCSVTVPLSPKEKGLLVSVNQVASSLLLPTFLFPFLLSSFLISHGFVQAADLLPPELMNQSAFADDSWRWAGQETCQKPTAHQAPPLTGRKVSHLQRWGTLTLLFTFGKIHVPGWSLIWYTRLCTQRSSVFPSSVY